MLPVLIVLGFLISVVILFAVVIFSQKQEEVEQQLPYKLKTFFFTRSEQQFFRILEEKLDHSKYTVFPKVRMGDFIEVDLPSGERMPWWNRIKSRHVDFLVWDIQRSSIAVAIELDGYSHNGQKAKEVDDFKDEVYKDIGLELFRIRVGTDFAVEIDNILSKLTSCYNDLIKRKGEDGNN